MSPYLQSLLSENSLKKHETNTTLIFSMGIFLAQHVAFICWSKHCWRITTKLQIPNVSHLNTASYDIASHIHTQKSETRGKFQILIQWKMEKSVLKFKVCRRMGTVAVTQHNKALIIFIIISKVYVLKRIC